MKLNYTATCLFGLEGFLGEEIEALGCKRTDNMDGRITFEGDENTAAEASVNLRYAERLYLNLGSFEALTFTELFDNAKDPNEWLGYNRLFESNIRKTSM